MKTIIAKGRCYKCHTYTVLERHWMDWLCANCRLKLSSRRQFLHRWKRWVPGPFWRR